MPKPPNEEWWTPQQIVLVEDRSRGWRLTSFEVSNAVALESDNQTAVGKREPNDGIATAARIVPGGWDHEHCALCWRKISLLAGADPSGYTDGQDWVCGGCYEKFIKPRMDRP